ncbi:unnamed protein product [Symbiodinium natans]|uniref:Uncharacterized protein n=1 Tax=Symbiodinium natans TaxID=878477 RepID=A0A812S515_9DINO|nr:unnamed protein product [Symbiodinium natans]
MYKDVMAQASSSLAQVVGQVDLDAAFGQGARDLVEATLEEFSGSKDECEAICQALCCICLLCSHVDCHCCDDCLRGLGRRRRSSSWLETPKQQVMEDGPTPSLLERFASLTSEDLGAVVRGAGSQQWNLQERLGLWLFEQKFSAPEREQLEKCMEQVKAAAPDLLTEDLVNTTEVEQQLNSHNAKVLAKLFKFFAVTAVAKHGAQIAEGGLGALNIGECEKVLCAGDLKYELDETGIHQCTWSCPADGGHPLIPGQFQSVGLSLAEQVQDLQPWRDETAQALQAVDESKQLHSEEDFETSKAWAMAKDVDVRFHKALSGDPLVLLKTQTPSELGRPEATALRYHGKCVSDAFAVGERLIFTGQSKDIPHEAVVKINRLATSGWFELSPVPAQHLEVKYLGQKVIVPISQVRRETMGKVRVDPALQDWLYSTKNHLEVTLPAKHDPSRQQVADTLWLPVKKDKGE